MLLHSSTAKCCNVCTISAFTVQYSKQQSVLLVVLQAVLDATRFVL
jgi:hypothetical protein